jgi:GntR family transcriptional regulator
MTLTRVSRSSEVPLYLQLKKVLLDKIAREELRSGAAIPSERELEETFGLSRTTVRQAINELVRDGVLYRYQGRGTFVARPKIQPALHRLTSFSEDMRMRGLRPGGRILENGLVPAPPDLAQLLQITDATPLLYLKRLRLADDEPIGLHHTWLSLGAQRPPDVATLTNGGSLYQMLEDEYDIRLKEADETLEVTVADDEEAELLQIPPTTPLLLIQRLTFSDTGRPVEFVKMLYRVDRYKYYVHMTR